MTKCTPCLPNFPCVKHRDINIDFNGGNNHHQLRPDPAVQTAVAGMVPSGGSAACGLVIIKIVTQVRMKLRLIIHLNR